MPGETGARLLAASRRLHPTAQRLLLTDWADFSTIDDTVQALTVGEIDTWVARPFGPADEEFHTVLTAALARWTHEADRAGVALTIVGEPWDPSTGVLRDAFARLLLPFRFRDAASPEGRALLDAAGVQGPLPVVDPGRWASAPTGFGRPTWRWRSASRARSARSVSTSR